MRQPSSRQIQTSLLAALTVTILLAAWYVARQTPLAQIAAQENALRQWIVDSPVRAFLIGVVVYTISSLIPGTSGKSIVFGWLYGFVHGVVIVLIGLTAAAMMTFWLSRGLLRPLVESRFGLLVHRLNSIIAKDPAACMLTLQFANMPYTLINYLAGASRLNAWTFCWTTFVGLLPGTLLFVYVGTTLPTLEQLLSEGVLSLIDPQLLGSLMLLAVVPFTVRWCIRRWSSPVKPAPLERHESRSHSGSARGMP